jgi:5-methylcytosine-specific restriction endonuclease McrA
MRKTKYTIERLAPIVESSYSYSEVLTKLGLRNVGGNYQNIQGHIKRLGLSTTHFTGQAWSKGKTANEDSRIRRTGYTDTEVFVKHGPVLGGDKLKPRMLRNGFTYKCAKCANVGQWLNHPLTLHIDHIDGDHANNMKENLQFLCPNCHQQTGTWGNVNKGEDL